MDTTSSSIVEQGMLPDIDGARCVHSHSHLASCRLCVDACPDDALVMNDELFGVNEDACSFCGLCQPACPQNAISMKETVPVDKGVALLECNRAPDATGKLSIQCIHSQGLEQLARLYQKNVRQIALLTGDCDHCNRYRKTGFFVQLTAFNRLAESRGLAPVELITADIGHWQAWLEDQAKSGIANKGRRAFLHSLVAPVIEEEAKPEKNTALARLQERSENDPATACYAAIPAIDPQKCNGCDACINICPEHALILVKEESALLQYTFLSHCCTGCGLCVDVCQMGAMSLEEMTSQSVSAVELCAKTCKSCGAGFHLPKMSADLEPNKGSGNSDLCRICSMTGHNRKLFQVLT